MFFLQLVAGLILICITVVIHAFALVNIMKFLENLGPFLFKKNKKSWKTIVLSITVLSVFMAHIAQIWVWTLFYIIFTDDLRSLEEALYFSTSTFTTLGMGDIVLSGDWRLMSAFQSANGFILFGWSTAFIFEIMSKLYREERISNS